MILQNNSLPLKNALTNHYLPNKVLDKRWLLAIPFVIALILYAVLEMAIPVIRSNSLPTPWDLLIGVLTNHPIVHHGLINTYIYLVSGIGRTEQLETQLLLRVGSRKYWLKAQVICVLLYVALYIGLVLLSTSILAMPFTRFSWQWGGFIQSYLGEQGAPDVWLQLSPGMTALFMIILMIMTWIFMGIATVLTTILTQHPVLGFLCGMILNYSAFITAQTDTIWLQKIWLSRYMFLWNDDVIADSILIHFIFSCLYWIILNAIGIVTLWILVKKLDFTASYQPEQTLGVN